MLDIGYVVVGAGLSGAVIAERIANELGEKVLVVERRGHVGGNCHDYLDPTGIIVHSHGPHLFHTDDRRVFEYLSNFTDWRLYFHRVLAFVDGKKVPLPFNFRSMDVLFPERLSDELKEKLISRYGYGARVPILDLKSSGDEGLAFLADFVYEKIFKNYTLKQWGSLPEEIDPSVSARVPVYVSYQEGYFSDRYQAVPVDGYSRMIRRMLSSRNVKLLLNTDFGEIGGVDFDSGKVYLFGQEFRGKFVFTGMIDELMGYRFGVLPYRSLRFDFKTYDLDYFQDAASVNYPNNHDFTRITEFKHIHPPLCCVKKTVVAFEYPKECGLHDIPYYPVFTSGAQEAYFRYRELARRVENLVLVGRLAEYRYYDMDDAVKRALDVFEGEIL